MTENSDECKKLVRGFVVLVDESTYDVKSHKSTHDITCVTQLMGQQDVLDDLKEKAEKWN